MSRWIILFNLNFEICDILYGTPKNDLNIALENFSTFFPINPRIFLEKYTKIILSYLLAVISYLSRRTGVLSYIGIWPANAVVVFSNIT